MNRNKTNTTDGVIETFTVTYECGHDIEYKDVVYSPTKNSVWIATLKNGVGICYPCKKLAEAEEITANLERYRIELFEKKLFTIPGPQDYDDYHDYIEWANPITGELETVKADSNDKEFQELVIMYGFHPTFEGFINWLFCAGYTLLERELNSLNSDDIKLKEK